MDGGDEEGLGRDEEQAGNTQLLLLHAEDTMWLLGRAGV